MVKLTKPQASPQPKAAPGDCTKGPVHFPPHCGCPA